LGIKHFKLIAYEINLGFAEKAVKPNQIHFYFSNFTLAMQGTLG